MIEPWDYKYCPRNFTEYVWEDLHTKEVVERWIKDGATDNLLFTGLPGVGKTTLGHIILDELNIVPEDRLIINASREGNIDVVRNKIQNFVSFGGWNGMRYVFLDEADGISRGAQEALRGDMVDYITSVRWILTANYRNRIIHPIRDRCTEMHINAPSRDQFMERMINILISENINIESEESLQALEDTINLAYPSLRKCIKLLQKQSLDGVLTPPKDKPLHDWGAEAQILFESGKIREAREYICSHCVKEEIESVYRWLYDQIMGDDSYSQSQRDESVVIIADGLYRHASSADPEITLSSTFIRLARLKE